MARYIRVRQLVFPKSTTGWRGTYESAGWCFRSLPQGGAVHTSPPAGVSESVLFVTYISHTAISKGKGNNRDDCLLGTQENQIRVKSLLVSEIILTRLLAATEVESSFHNLVG